MVNRNIHSEAHRAGTKEPKENDYLFPSNVNSVAHAPRDDCSICSQRRAQGRAAAGSARGADTRCALTSSLNINL